MQKWFLFSNVDILSKVEEFCDCMEISLKVTSTLTGKQFLDDK